MKIIQIITILISSIMLYLAIGFFLNSGLDAKYSVSQSDLDYFFNLSKIIIAYNYSYLSDDIHISF